jgi:hypothetical protein
LEDAAIDAATYGLGRIRKIGPALERALDRLRGTGRAGLDWVLDISNRAVERIRNIRRGRVTNNNVPDVPEGVPYFRVQNGGSGTATSRDALTVNADGSLNITPGCTGAICVSAESSDHAVYYLSNRRPGGNVVVYEVDRVTHNQIMEVAVEQAGNSGAPVQIVDPTTSENAISLQLNQVYSALMINGASNSRVLTHQEFLREFGSD